MSNFFISNITNVNLALKLLNENNFYTRIKDGLNLTEINIYNFENLCFRIKNNVIQGFGNYEDYKSYIENEKFYLGDTIYDVVSFNTILRNIKIKNLL